MEVGKFKSSRGRLVAWILVPPLLIVGIGLSSFAMRLQSEVELDQTKRLAEMLPQVVMARQEAEALLDDFYESGAGSVQTEDELISFLQGFAAKVDFRVNSLKVDRRTKGPVTLLVATVKGNGSFNAVQQFLGDVTANQQLLSESALQITQMIDDYGVASCRMDVTFELVLSDSRKGAR
ncbi:hypothetical protein [Pontiella sp.]|uniref:hypothetical protein n=1 Tax=Pontiella sp. TaxID=2837462 RepID=UPI003564FD71